MSEETKRKLISWAEAFNAWRVFPRLFFGVYIYLLYETVTWFMLLDAPTMEQAGLISVITGAGAAWFGQYVASGNGKNTHEDED